MIGRITQLMTSQQTISQLNQSLSKMDTTQQEISSGKRISQPSDDPYGASQAIKLSGDLSSLTNYSSGIADATAWTSATDTSLTAIEKIVQRVQELTLAAANGTTSPADRSDSAQEVNQMIDSIKDEANTQYSGQYIFGGTGPATPSTPPAPTPPPYGTTTYSTSTPPVPLVLNDAYSGKSGAVTRAIGPGSTITINTDLSQLLGGSTTSTGNLLSVLRNISADMSGTGTTANLGTTDLAGLQASLNTLGGIQANVGATENRLQLATTRISNLQISDTAALSNVQDVDMASALTTYSNEQASYTAALKVGASIVQQSLLSFLN
jgi:flagellar hook-associated protein 3 FlgL